MKSGAMPGTFFSESSKACESRSPVSVKDVELGLRFSFLRSLMHTVIEHDTCLVNRQLLAHCT